MGPLSRTDRVLCVIYGLLGVAALVGTQLALVEHLRSDPGTFSAALENTVVNPAATFTVIDLLAVALVGLVFIIVEGRRLGMRFLWVYVLLSFAVAISVALPAFLIARQVHLANQRQVAAHQPA